MPEHNEENIQIVSATAQNTEKAFVRKEVLRIKCVGTTTFQERLLIVYTDHIEFWKGEQSSLLFSENYDNIVKATGTDSKVFYNKFNLHLKNGETFKFSLDIRYDLKGNYYSRPIFNTDIKQLAKTLPGYINKLIAEYKNSGVAHKHVPNDIPEVQNTVEQVVAQPTTFENVYNNPPTPQKPKKKKWIKRTVIATISVIVCVFLAIAVDEVIFRVRLNAYEKAGVCEVYDFENVGKLHMTIESNQKFNSQEWSFVRKLARKCGFSKETMENIYYSRNFGWESEVKDDFEIAWRRFGMNDSYEIVFIKLAKH